MKPVAHLTTNHPKLVLTFTVLLVFLGAAIGSTVIPKLSSSGYNAPGSDSSAVAASLEDGYRDHSPHLSFALGIRGEKDAALGISTSSVASELTKDLEGEYGVDYVVSYWGTGLPSLASKDRSLGMIYVYLKDGALDEKNSIAKQITAKVPESISGVEIYAGGTGVVYNSINGQITDDLKKAEYFAIPLTLVMLLVIFGSVMSALQPLLVGVSAIGVSLFGVWIYSMFAEASVFSLNLLTGLGLGLGIDYALLIINRYREELANGLDPAEAVAVTVHTAGRTVMFSGFTVATTLTGMFFMKQPFLQSLGFAGLVVCLMAVFGALVPLPAILRLVGRGIDKGKVRRKIPTPTATGRWERIARAVMRRPWITITLVIALLGSLSAITLTAKFGQVDYRVLPADHRTVLVTEIWEKDFGGYEAVPIEVLVPKDYSHAEIGDLAADISRIGHVVSVATADAEYANGAASARPAGWQGVSMAADGTERLRAFADVEPRSEAGKTLIDQIRALDSSALVGGSAAEYTDSQYAIANNLPWTLLWVIGFTLVLLFLFTGSVVLPIKAVLLNLLSLGAAIGVSTWIFQDGNLQWLTGDFIVTGHLDLSTLVMIIIVTFGLSMDYEVFLLSRIKEEHDAGANTVDSVAVGLQRSGRIITAAAVLLATVFASFITGSVTVVKMIGLGIGFAILLDATVVRGLLVPALMKVMGRINWWAPRWLGRIYGRVGIHD